MRTHSPTDVHALINTYIERGMTDGLPVVPPTEESVSSMIKASGRESDSLVGETKFRTEPISVRDVAVNAVMAGCLPEYMRIVVPAFETLLDEFNGMFIVSTAAFTPLLILNGPLRHEINVNCGTDVLGPGYRANMTIGRAIRLSAINLCGARPGLWNRSTMGSAYELSWVVGEDEEASPWPGLHTEFGFAPDDNVVSVAIGMHPFEINHLDVRDPEPLLLTFADFFAQSTHFNNAFVHEEKDFERHPNKGILMLGYDHRDWVAKAGWSKEDMKTFLVENTTRRVGDIRARQFSGYNKFPPSAADDDLVHLFDKPDDITIIAAGGPGAHSNAARLMGLKPLIIDSQ